MVNIIMKTFAIAVALYCLLFLYNSAQARTITLGEFLPVTETAYAYLPEGFTISLRNPVTSNTESGFIRTANRLA